MTGKPRDFFGAFVVGGAISAACQCLVLLYSGLGLPPVMIPILMLATISVVSTILYVFGIYGKLTVFGGMGAILPFCGLAPAICTALSNQLKGGVKAGKAVWEALKPIALIFAIGYMFCFCIALVLYGTV